MKIYEFTVPELNYLRTNCNFTADESALFKLRSKHISLETCAEKLNMSVSTVKRLSAKVNSKVSRVISNFCDTF